MKNIIYALAILFTLNIAAQEGTDNTDRKERKEMRKEKGKKFMEDLTPEQIAQLHTKKLTLALDLSDSQKQRILALNTANAKVKKQKMKARKAKMEKKEKPTSEEKYAMMNEQLDSKIAYKQSMKQILSKEQYEKWEKMHANKGKRKQKKKGKRGGKR
jgi:protein CpxP